MYADDTATLGTSTPQDSAPKQRPTLVTRARSSKMVASGEKTQILVLSQWARDAVEVTMKVAGATVEARETLNLLRVTLNRPLHFGPHCKRLRQPAPARGSSTCAA